VGSSPAGRATPWSNPLDSPRFLPERARSQTPSRSYGNAGDGSSGSVRLGSSPPRAKLPQSITFPDIQAKTADKLGAPADQIWVYVVVRYSEFWADLGAIDTSAAGVWQSAWGGEFLKKYKLKPAPVST
jgi:hypothetical protein